MQKKTYYAATPIEHDAVRYEAGEAIELNFAEARSLGEAVSASAPQGADAGQMDAVAAAIGELDPDDEGSWTKSGKPEIKALEALLGADLTAAMRDEAWAAFQAAR